MVGLMLLLRRPLKYKRRVNYFICTMDYEQSLFFLLSSSSSGKDIVNAGVRKPTRNLLFALSFLRFDQLKRKNRDLLVV